MNDLTTGFLSRLRARDADAWFELWEIFGPVLRAQLGRWGRGRIGIETIQDLSQETMVALASAIDRHDPNQGARFSTWLLAIARYTLGDEIDRRMAQKRGSGVKPKRLDDSGFGGMSPDLSPDAAYELAVFDAKVDAALRQVKREVEFTDFEIFRRRVLEGQSGKEVAKSLGTSEPTVSRRLASVRKHLRAKLFETFSKFSFTPEEMAELERNGIELNPNKKSEAEFEEAVADVYHRSTERRAAEAAQGSTA